MKKTKWILLAGSFCAIAAIGASGAKPDFTGTWKLNTDKSTPDGPAGRVYSNEIQQQASTIKVTTKATPAPEGVVLDGAFRTGANQASAKTVVENRNGHYHSTKVYWEGSTLVFEIVNKDGPKLKSKTTDVIRESWTLSPNGQTLTKFRRTAAAGKVIDQKYVFDKQ